MDWTITRTSGTATPATLTVGFATITTPWVFPTDQPCDSFWRVTSADYGDGESDYVTSDHLQSGFESCQPEGFEHRRSFGFGFGLFSYRLGVCPESWTYWHPGNPRWSQSTTAMCCAPHFSLSSADTVPWNVHSYLCVYEYTATDDFVGERPTDLPLSAIQVHQPWEVEWESTDISVLPDFVTDLPSEASGGWWYPANNTWSDGGENKKALTTVEIAMIATWLTIFLAICICCCCHRRRSRKKKTAGRIATNAGRNDEELGSAAYSHASFGQREVRERGQRHVVISARGRTQEQPIQHMAARSRLGNDSRMDREIRAMAERAAVSHPMDHIYPNGLIPRYLPSARQLRLAREGGMNATSNPEAGTETATQPAEPERSSSLQQQGPQTAAQTPDPERPPSPYRQEPTPPPPYAPRDPSEQPRGAG